MGETKPRRASLSAQVATIQEQVKEIPRLARRITSLEEVRKLDREEHAQNMEEHRNFVKGHTDRIASMIGRQALEQKKLEVMLRALMDHVGVIDPGEPMASEETPPEGTPT